MATDPPDFLLSFVVPLYNTGDCIVKVFDAFRDLPVPGGYELVLVNDASQDDTYARAKDIIPSMPIPVTLIDMARNFGEHSAVLEGFRIPGESSSSTSTTICRIRSMKHSGCSITFARPEQTSCTLTTKRRSIIGSAIWEAG